MMSADEGVIKFKIQYKPDAPPPVKEFREINEWREVLYELKLIGQTYYENQLVGYGNISKRIPLYKMTPPRFIITATQTGFYPRLSPKQYATVLACYPEENKVISQGPSLPSSESMTHGIIYALDANIRWVFHAHSAVIWQNAEELELPVTNVDVAYGTPEMTGEVERLFRETEVVEIGMFSMGGHEDGVISFGNTAEEAAGIMLGCLGLALELESKNQT